MDIKLHEKYKNLRFPSNDITDMYIDILEDDPVFLKVFLFIAKQSQSNQHSDTGITINELVSNIEVERLMKKNKGTRNFTYENALTNLHRKTAERLVDKLQVMSLLYFKSVRPYKYFYLTIRGKQLLQRIVELKREKKELNHNG